MSLGERIRKARIARGMSQSALAEALMPPVTREAVSQWEEVDGTAPRRKRMADLAKILNVGEVWLETGAAAKSPGDSRRDELRRIISENDLSAKSWATKAGVSPNVLYNFFQGRSRSLSFDTMEKLAKAQGQSISELFDLGEATSSDNTAFNEILMRAVIKAAITSLGQRISELSNDQFADLIVSVYSIERNSASQNNIDSASLTKAVRSWIAGAQSARLEK